MLTDIKIRNLKAGTKARKVFDEKGLYVQVQPKKDGAVRQRSWGHEFGLPYVSL